MPTSVLFVGATTQDKAPNASPYKVSKIAGHNTAVVKWFHEQLDGLVPSDGLLPADGSLYPGDGLYPGAGLYPGGDGSYQPTLTPGPDVPVPDQDFLPAYGYVIRRGGASVDTGNLVEQRTSVCWDGAVCTDDLVIESDYEVASNTQTQATLLMTEIESQAPLGADGSYPFTIYVAVAMDQGD